MEAASQHRLFIKEYTSLMLIILTFVLANIYSSKQVDSFNYQINYPSPTIDQIYSLKEILANHDVVLEISLPYGDLDNLQKFVSLLVTNRVDFRYVNILFSEINSPKQAVVQFSKARGLVGDTL